MPDFERLTDKLMLDLARTPEDKAYARGYSEGKRKARMEIALLAAVLGGLSSFAVMLLFMWTLGLLPIVPGQ